MVVHHLNKHPLLCTLFIYSGNDDNMTYKGLLELPTTDIYRMLKVGHLLSDLCVGISDVEFSDTLLMNLLHKIRHRKICIGIVVSNVDRIRVPTVDDQP